MSKKLQIELHGKWMNIEHFAVEKINDTTFVSIILNDVSAKHLRRIADEFETQFKPCIVAVVSQ